MIGSDRRGKSKGNGKRGEGGRTYRRVPIVAGALVLIVAGTAVAVGLRLQNPGFESDFGSWVVEVDRPLGNGVPGDDQGKPNRQVVYGPGGNVSSVVPCVPGDRYGVCIVTGDDTFVLGLGETKTVSPRYGTKMLRLGGPYTNPYQRQTENHRFMVEQTFTVDAATPTVRLRYKLYTYDPLHWRYNGSGPLRFGGRDRLELTVLDSAGDVVRSKSFNTHFNHGEGLDLRATRWLRQRVHLREFVGEDVTLQIGFSGVGDRKGGSWAYVDATEARTPPTNPPPTGAPPTGSPAATPDTTAPKVVGLKGPKGKLKVKSKKRKAKAKFTFGSDEAGANFECALDRAGFKACNSPYKVKLKVGKHKLSVRAIDTAGNVGPPAATKVKVKVK